MTEEVRGDADRDLEAMMGPPGPELGCVECFDQLDSYVELELSGAGADAAMPKMRPHLAGCPACRDDHDSLFTFVRDDLPDPA